MSALNRRTVIAAAASVAALGAATPAIAARQSRFAEVVAAFEAARSTFNQAIEIEERADTLLKQIEQEPILSPRVGKEFIEYRGRDADEAFETVEKAIRAHAYRLRKELESIGADASQVGEWEVQAMNEARTQLAVWQARRNDCGYTAAQSALMSAMDAETDALLVVLAYRPVSQHDARAKVQWVCERLGRHEISGLHGAFECLLESTLPEGEELHEQDNGSWTIASVDAVS